MDQVSMSSAYMWSIVIMSVFFLIAVIIANLVVYKPKDPGTATRRLWFWILCVCTGVFAFIINYIIGRNISIPSLQSDYYMHSGIAAGVVVMIYIAAGFFVSKIFPKAKVGTWF